MATPPRLSMAGIWKSFGSAAVLQDVTLDLAPGEVLALLGANGAGKSTLIKILCGVYRKDRGTIHLNGKKVALPDPTAAIAQGVRLLPQEIAILPDLSVAENILIGDLPLRGRWQTVLDRDKMRSQAAELLGRLGLKLDLDQPLHQLSPPQQRLVEIARALAGQAQIIVMDEPTAALTQQETAALFTIIERLKEQDISVIYISHYLDEVFRIADRIAVLRDGLNAGTFSPATTSRQEVLNAMLGSSMDALYPPKGTPSDQPVLSVDGLSVPAALDRVSFSVNRGEIKGIFGLLGSGIDQVGRALYGALGPIEAKSISLNGKPYTPSNPRRGRDAGLGFVAAERQREGIVPDLSVSANTTLPFIHRFLHWGALSSGRENRHTTAWIDQLEIRTAGLAQPLRQLSGGNQQKVCLARWLVEGIQLLIMEEPTRGVDLGARRQLYTTLRQWTEKGLAVLVVSSDAEEVAGLCDSCLVLDRGRLGASFSAEVSPAQLVDAALNKPAATRRL